MKRTTADGCSLVNESSDLGEIASLEDFVIGVELNTVGGPVERRYVFSAIPALLRAAGAPRIGPEERHDRRSWGTIRVVRCRSALCGANRAQIEYETVE